MKDRDRLFWVWLRRIWPAWHRALVLVQPATVVKWHRKGFRAYGRRKSGPRRGRPRIDPEIRKPIRDRWRANPMWGKPRIQAELRKIGIEVSDSTTVSARPRPHLRSTPTRPVIHPCALPYSDGSFATYSFVGSGGGESQPSLALRRPAYACMLPAQPEQGVVVVTSQSPDPGSPSIGPLEIRISPLFLGSMMLIGVLEVGLGVFVYIEVAGSDDLAFKHGPVVGGLVCLLLVLWGGYELLRAFKHRDWRLRLGETGVQVGDLRMDWGRVARIEYKAGAVLWRTAITITGDNGSVAKIPACGCGNRSSGRVLGAALTAAAGRHRIAGSYFQGGLA